MKKISAAQRATGKRRLLKLADVLDTIPRKRFDYDEWVGPDWEGAPDLSCGATACALGWATTVPAFRRLGLSLVKLSYGGADPVLRVPGKRNAYKQDAAARLFNLTEIETEYLFLPTETELNATAKQVARKIRRFVQGGLPSRWLAAKGYAKFD